jgi:hypothetical protein
VGVYLYTVARFRENTTRDERAFVVCLRRPLTLLLHVFFARFYWVSAINKAYSTDRDFTLLVTRKRAKARVVVVVQWRAIVTVRLPGTSAIIDRAEAAKWNGTETVYQLWFASERARSPGRPTARDRFATKYIYKRQP